jgi:aerobic-type carbon monoxide dehydrogenase small subunit (CoxS/CutS family)
MSGPIEVTLSVNGRDYALRPEPRRTLLDAIRDGCGLTGTIWDASMACAVPAPCYSTASRSAPA